MFYSSTAVRSDSGPPPKRREQILASSVVVGFAPTELSLAVLLGQRDSKRETCGRFVTLTGIQRGPLGRSQKIGDLATTVTAGFDQARQQCLAWGLIDP
jgi:hypothetical protein